MNDMNDVTILVDFNNLAFRHFFIKDIDIESKRPNFALWRYNVYEGIYSLLSRIQNVGEVIVAVDSRTLWRKSYFPRYKESRKKSRDKKKNIDWTVLYDTINEYLKDLRHHMPFKIIGVKGAEADDVIAVLAKNLDNRCVVVSNDEDYLQLYSKRIRIWNPSKKKYTTCDNVDDFIVSHCLTGQSKDDIFNIKTPDDWGLTEATKGKRKPGFGPKSAEKVMAEGYKDWLKRNDLEERYHRNEVLMNFDFIPNTIVNRTLKVYYDYNFPPPENIYRFFNDNGMRGYIDEFQRVENTLLRLY
jgi:5'-3' exonuclease